MRLIDTMVLVGALNPKDSLHQEAFGHLDTVKRDLETFLPLTPADLQFRGGYQRPRSIEAFPDDTKWIPSSMRVLEEDDKQVLLASVLKHLVRVVICSDVDCVAW